MKRRIGIALVALLPCVPMAGPMARMLHAGDALAQLGHPPDNEVARQGTTRRYGRATAPRLVLMHGVHADGPEDPRIDALARVVADAGFRVHVPSLPGLRALRPDARDLRSAERELGEGAGVLGVSVGGSIALRLAAEHPSRVRALWTIGAPRELRSVLASSRRPGADPYLREVADSMTRGRSVEAALAAMAPILPGPALPRVRAPVYAMHGADDELIDPAHAGQICAEVPRCRALVSPVLSHAATHEAGLAEKLRFAQFLAAAVDALR